MRQFEGLFLRSSDRFTCFQIPIVDDGRADAIVVWWTLDCDPDGAIQLSTQPVWIESSHEQQKWRQHWKQCWAPLPSVTVQKTTHLTLQFEHDDLDITIGMQPQQTGTIDTKEQ